MMPTLRASGDRMATKKKPKNVDVSPTMPATRSLWKRPWIWGPAVIAGLAALLLNVNTILRNARELPGEWGKTADQFSSWYHEDAAWNGKWTNNPEGYVDLADMGLSKDDIEIALIVKDGEIGGTIATKAICDRVPFVDFILLRGDLSGGHTANVIAWDIFGGHKTDIAKLKLERDGITMKVTFEEGANQLFPAEAKIARDPNFDPNKVSEPPVQDEEFCEGKTERTIKGVREAVEKLRYSPGKTAK